MLSPLAVACSLTVQRARLPLGSDLLLAGLLVFSLTSCFPSRSLIRPLVHPLSHLFADSLVCPPACYTLSPDLQFAFTRPTTFRTRSRLFLPDSLTILLSVTYPFACYTFFPFSRAGKLVIPVPVRAFVYAFGMYARHRVRASSSALSCVVISCTIGPAILYVTSTEE